MPIVTLAPSSLPDAGLWRRLAAGAYDGLLLLAIWFVIGFAYAMLRSAVQPPVMDGPIEPLLPAEVAPWVIPAVLWAVTALFYGWFWRHGGQTLGMRAWRLKLVRTEGGRPDARQCLVRSAVGTLSLFAGLLGFLWLLVDRDGRTWHDRASRTRVLLLPK